MVVVNDVRYWQIKCYNVRQRSSRLYKLGQWTDCDFRVGTEAVTVPAHRLVLAIASPVFEAMFYGALAHEDKVEPIAVPDMELEAFNALLQYIYTDYVTIKSCTVAFGLYYGAQKYMLPKLKSKSLHYLQNNITPQNVGLTYEFAQLFDQEYLVQLCLEVIKRDTLKVLKSDSFTELQIDTVAKIFSLEPLNVKSELDLYDAAVEYTSYSVKDMETVIIKLARNLESSTNEDIKEQEGQKVNVAINSAQQSNGAVYEGDQFIVNAESQIQEELVDKDSIKTGDQSIVKDGTEASDQSIDKDSTEAMDISGQSVKKGSTDAVQVVSEGNVKDKAADDKLQCDDALKNKGDPPELPIRKAVKNIRFLAMEPQEFSDHDFSLILSQAEIFAITLNLISKTTHALMPIGFSTNRKSRIQINKANDPKNGRVVMRTVVNNINDLNETSSPPFDVRNITCFVTTKMSIENKKKCLGVFLHCEFESDFLGSCDFQAEFRLLSNRIDTRYFCKKYKREFRGAEYSWGWDDFMEWDELMDPENGYVTHDSITWEVHVRAGEIKEE